MKDTEALRENLKNIYKSAATAIESLSAFRDNLKVLNKVRDSCAFFSAIAGLLDRSFLIETEHLHLPRVY